MLRVVVCVGLLQAAVGISSILMRDANELQQPLASTNVLGSKERPVMKVVRLLQDMQVELQRSMDDDKAVHKQLSCWCETNRKDKTAAIEAGEQKEEQLKAFIGETWATIQGLQVKRKTTRDEQYADQKSLDSATAMRTQEAAAFHTEEKFLLEAIDAAQQAIVVLSAHHPELAQVRSIAKRLETANVMRLMHSSNSLQQDQMDLLKDFLKKPESSSAFLAIPGFRSYAPQSGQIFGILKQMKADFESSLTQSQRNEAKAREEFQALKAAKTEEIETGAKAVTAMGQLIADHTEKHAVAINELEDTQAQLELDRAFLADLEKKCAETSEEFDRRMAARNAEIVAVQETIAILNSDTAFDNFDKTVNVPEAAFIQTASEVQDRRLSKVSALLKEAAVRTGSPKLALLASSAGLDAFTKVKAAIDKMIAELAQQNEDEIKHRDWCTKEFSTNERDTADADHRKADLESSIEELKQTIASLSKDIEHETSVIAEMQEQMKRASENREAANADYIQTITDQRLTQQILTKALQRMQAVYSEAVYDKNGRRTQFLQQPGAPHIATSGTHTDAGNGPARFTKYEEHAGGDRVVAMLEEIIADSKKMENEAMAAEEDAQTAYESFMKDSNKGVASRTKAIMHMTEARAKAKERLSMAKTDLTSTVKELEDLFNTKGDLHQSCDFVLKNFQARQSARTAEIDALKEANAILSGMK